MRPMGDKVFTSFDGVVKRHGSTILKGYYHVFSYQVVDVMNEDGTLKEIRVYAWADGKQMFNGEYYTISTDHHYWIERFANPAALISSTNDGFDIVSITFGDELSQEYVTTIPEQVIIAYGETYEYQLKTAIKGAQIESITYTDGSGKTTTTQPTKVGSYTVEIVASAPNYMNVLLTGTFIIERANFTDLEVKGGTFDYGTTGKVRIVNKPSGAQVEYKLGTGNYSTTAPTFTEPGTYDVQVKVSKSSFNTLYKTVTITILPIPTGDEWTDEMLSKVVAVDKTYAHTGKDLTYLASCDIEGAKISYFYEDGYIPFIYSMDEQVPVKIYDGALEMRF